MTRRWDTVRALAWKEWREQRALALAGIGLAILIPLILMAITSTSARPLDMASLAGVLPGIYIAMLWPLFATAAGAATIANEIGDGTLGFLLSRPISRARIWSVKVVIAFLSALLILAASLAVSILVALLAGEPIVPVGVDEPLISGGPGAGALAGVLFGTMTPLLFATSVFFSTFVPRAMTAAAAGLAAALLILAGLFTIWSRLDLVPRLEPEWMLLEVWLASGLILLASLFVFSRGELLRGGGTRRLVAIVALMTVGVLGLMTLPLVQIHGRLTPSTATYLDITPSPAGDALVATVTASTRLSPQIWLIHSDGSGMERLTGSLTFGSTISPDGKWIAYFSQRGPFGLRSSDVELRVIGADGNHDHRIASMALHPWVTRARSQIAFSPDGTRIAALGANRLVIAANHGGESRTIEMPTGSVWAEGTLAGWRADGAEVLLLSSTRQKKDAASSTLAAVDAASGRLRPIYQAPATASIWLPQERSMGWTKVPLVVDGSLLLLDPDSGRTETICDRTAFWSPRISDDGRLLAYAVRHGAQGEPGESEIHVRDLATGSDRILAMVQGVAGRIAISPSNDAFIVNRYSRDKPLSSVALTSEGAATELPSGWVCLGWHGRERILVSEGPETGRLAVIDVASLELRGIFP